MNILSIYSGHNATVSFFENGECKKVIHEEKFSNIKNHAGFPHMSLKYLSTLFDFSTVDYVVFPFTDLLWLCVPYKEEPVYFKENQNTYLVGNIIEDMSRSWLRKVYDFLEYNTPLKGFFFALRNILVKKIIAPKAKKEINGYLERTYGFNSRKIRYIDHHTSHVCSTVYFYNLQKTGADTLLFSMDGAGDTLFSTVCIYRAGENRIERIAKSDFSASLGLLYSGLTRFLGMKPNEHEYKVMGLAAYVTDKKYYKKAYDTFAEIIWLDEKNLEFKSKFNMNLTVTSGKYLNRLVGERFDNVSAGLQNFLEDITCRWIKAAIAKTGIRRITCSGGSFMNVKMNQRIQSMPEVEKAYFMPSCGDESTVLGCAPVIYMEKNQSMYSDETMFKGQSYSNDEVEKFLVEKGYFEKYSISRHDDIEKITSELLASYN
ncbi:MAG TPA: carbamoyltransferase N-terminal domain-containing protein, partial [Candidatus Goldiibacteriota bacterium]|nr:carbamoyltransferase N-terminal domain-containing protein [Candidatus Goldiibacteriota bacterium]